MMAFVLRSPYRKVSLATRLGELGRSRRRAGSTAAWLRGAVWVMLWATISVLLDAAFHLPAAARATLLVVGLVGSASVWVSIRRAGRVSTQPQAVARLLEDRFPKLNDALASAVDFLTAKTPPGSERFRQVAVLRAENLTKRLDLDDIVPSKRAWRSFQLAFLAGLAMLIPAAIFPRTAILGVVRLVDPFGKNPWPTKTQLALLSPKGVKLLLAKGDPLPLRFTVGGELPAFAMVELRLSGAATTAELVPVEPAEGATDAEIEVRLDAGRIPRDFEFRLKAGDAETAWFPVTVAAPPRLVPHFDRPSPQINLTFPAYTELPPVALPDGAGVVEGIAGTTVHFRAATDRRIVSAFFVPQFDLMNLTQQLSASPLATTNVFGAYVAARLADEAVSPIPVRVVGAEGTELEAVFAPNQQGLYQLQFADEDGLVGRRLFDFRLVPDPAPVLSLDRPLPGKDPVLLLPTASIPVFARAEDRPFAVKALHLDYRYGGPDGAWQTLVLSDLAQLPAMLPAVAGGGAGFFLPKPVTLESERSIPLSRLVKPNGNGPADGDRLTIRAAGVDWDDRTAMKEPGRSKELDLRILAKPSLEAEIQKDLATLRPELLRLNEQQREAAAKTTDLARKAAAGPLKPEDLAALAAADRNQSEVRGKIADPAEGIRTKVEQLKRTARAANLGRTPTTDKLEATATELNKLADQTLEAAEAALNTAKAEADAAAAGKGAPPEPKAVAEPLAKAGPPQKSAAESFKTILEKLEQWGGAGEVRGEAAAVQDQLAKNADKAAKAAEKIPPGKPDEERTPAERAEVGTSADQLDRTAEQTADLLTKAGRLAQQKDATAEAAEAKAADLTKAAVAARDAAKEQPAGSPEARAAELNAAALESEAAKAMQAATAAKAEADALRKAVKAAGGEQLPTDLRNAAELTRDQRPGEADQARKAADKRLQDFRDALDEKPQPEADELRKKAKNEAGEQIDRIAEQQDELRKKTKKAETMPEGKPKEDALKKLAVEQERLRRTTEDLLQRLTRETDPKSEQNAEALRKAAEQMDAAREQLENGKAATDKQEAALDKLDETLERLDRDKKDDQETLEREEREQLGNQLKLLRDKQKAVADESARLNKAAAEAKLWDRPLQRSLRDLAERQQALAEEVAAFRRKQLERFAVFNKLAEQSETAMTTAGKRLLERGDDIADADPDAPFDGVAETAAGKRTSKPIDLALRKLDQILDALKDDPKPKDGKPKEPKPDGEPMPPPDMPPMPPPAGKGLPPTAQLKALRAMQLDVNERTKAFADEHPDAAKLTADDKAELKELEQAQRDVAELFEKLAEELRKTMEMP